MHNTIKGGPQNRGIFYHKFNTVRIGLFWRSFASKSGKYLKKSPIKTKKFTFGSEMQLNVLIWILEIYAVFRKCMTRFPLLCYNIIYILILDVLDSPRLPKLPNYSKLDIFEIFEETFKPHLSCKSVDRLNDHFATFYWLLTKFRIFFASNNVGIAKIAQF